MSSDPVQILIGADLYNDLILDGVPKGKPERSPYCLMVHLRVDYFRSSPRGDRPILSSRCGAPLHIYTHSF